MGIDDRDDSYRSRGGAAPRRRSYDGDGDDYTPRSAPRNPRDARDPRDMSGPRSRPPRRDDDDEPARPLRGPGGPRSGVGGPNSAGGSSGRYPREDSDRRSGAGSYDAPRRSYESGASGYGARSGASRSGWSDPNAPAMRGASGVARNGRPPARDDGWSDPRSPRANAGPNSYGGRSVPGGSDPRMRRPAPGGSGAGRGGLWGDESGAFNAQAARARMAQQEDDEEEESGSPAAGIAKGLGAIILALVLGLGAAYGYFTVSAPKLKATPYQQSSPAVVPSTTPNTTPSASPHALIQPPANERTLLIG